MEMHKNGGHHEKENGTGYPRKISGDKISTYAKIIEALKPSFNTTSDTLILAAVKNYIRIGAYANSFVLKESSWNNMLDIIDNAGELKARVDWNDAVNNSFAKKVN